MPVTFVADIPTSRKGGKISKTTEWSEITDALAKPLGGKVLKLEISKETVNKYYGGKIKAAIVSFGQRLRLEYGRKGFTIKIVGDHIYISEMTLKLKKK